MNWNELENASIVIGFGAGFLLLSVYESLSPAAPLTRPTGRRWLNHGALLLAAAALQSVVLRTTPVVTALAVQNGAWGLLNRPGLPVPLQWLIAVLALDLAQYAAHRLFHAVPLLWRFHAVHHSDPDFDVSVAARFHPFEIVAATGVKTAAVALLCAPPGAALASELISTLVNLVSHANVALPPALERPLRAVFVTPTIHRVHHSADPADFNSNFGQALTCWDRLAGTWRKAPASSLPGFPTGIANFPESRHRSVIAILFAPFRKD
ncbi:MAG: sterol desaturase family protein [Acidobacteria bacterium]|nr:sterol desaturase family protein [Acidobacteriota bacterium]